MEIILYPERVPPRRVHTHNIILKKKEKNYMFTINSKPT